MTLLPKGPLEAGPELAVSRALGSIRVGRLYGPPHAHGSCESRPTCYLEHITGCCLRPHCLPHGPQTPLATLPASLPGVDGQAQSQAASTGEHSRSRWVLGGGP